MRYLRSSLAGTKMSFLSFILLSLQHECALSLSSFLDRRPSRPSFVDGASEREKPVTTDAEKEERDGEKPIVFNENFLVCLDRVPDSEQVCI